MVDNYRMALIKQSNDTGIFKEHAGKRVQLLKSTQLKTMPT
jgi:hypothetical protein